MSLGPLHGSSSMPELGGSKKQLRIVLKLLITVFKKLGEILTHLLHLLDFH